MATEFRFPTETGPTKSFTPSITANIGSKRGQQIGTLAHAMPDGITVYDYDIAGVRMRYFLQFNVINDADVQQFEDFMRTVKRQPFRAKFPVSLGAFVTVRVSPSQQQIIWADIGPDRFRGDQLLELWEAPGGS